MIISILKKTFNFKLKTFFIILKGLSVKQRRNYSGENPKCYQSYAISFH